MPETETQAPAQEGSLTQDASRSLENANQEALKYLDAKDQEAQGETPQVEPEPTEAQPQEGPAEAPEEAQGDQNVPASSWDLDWDGQRVQLPKENVDFLLRLGINAYYQGMQEKEGKAQPAAPAQPEGEEPQDPVQKALAETTKRLEALERQQEQGFREAEIHKAISEADDIWQKTELLKGITDPEQSQVAKGFLMYIKSLDPNMSWKTAADKLTKFVGKEVQKGKAEYVRGKIKQAGHRVEGSGGAVPVPGTKKFTADDLMKGKIALAALEQLPEQ